MDRPTPRKDADARTTRIDLPDARAFLPPSRQSVLDTCQVALEAGPVLLTGDAGIGKTWIIEELTRRTNSSRWIKIDLTPNDSPGQFYRYLARGLGLNTAGLVRPSRLDITEFLLDRSADLERYSVVIDEAHNLSDDVWEEVRVLLNRLGSDDGFTHLVLVGQTTLARRFATRSMAAIEARLAAHVHLRPFDVAEASQWLVQRYPHCNWTLDELEAIHRDAGGNPNQLSRRAGSMMVRQQPRVSHDRVESPRSVSRSNDLPSRTRLDNRPPNPLPLTGVDRPPLHVEENSIEVGWSDDDPDPTSFDEALNAADAESNDPTSLSVASPVVESEQAIHDHYAALQAWREWASNQEKRITPTRSDRDLADEIDEAAAAEAADATAINSQERTSLRTEGHQHFAPFGQLFTRMAPVRET